MSNLTKQKILFKSLDILLTYIIPIILIAFKYDLFKNVKSTIKLTAVGMIVVFVLVISLYRNILNAISKIKDTTTRKVLSVIRNMVIVIVCVMFLEMSKTTIDSLIFVIITCGISISIGNCMREDYREITNAEEKEQRQNEMIEAFKKAQE